MIILDTNNGLGDNPRSKIARDGLVFPEFTAQSIHDEYNLFRFIHAQETVYATVIQDLRWGRMRPDYMDFIFPRLAVRNGEPGSEPYAITSIDEASAYLAFPVLGGRYRECVGTLPRLAGLSARAVFGEVGARQLHASLTLFSEASDEFLFETMLYAWFDSLLDERTADALGLNG